MSTGTGTASREGVRPRTVRPVFFIASFEQEDFLLLRGLMEAGSVTPANDRTFDVDRMQEAFAYLGDGHARVKVVVTLWS